MSSCIMSIRIHTTQKQGILRHQRVRVGWIRLYRQDDRPFLERNTVKGKRIATASSRISQAGSQRHNIQLSLLRRGISQHHDLKQASHSSAEFEAVLRKCPHQILKQWQIKIDFGPRITTWTTIHPPMVTCSGYIRLFLTRSVVLPADRVQFHSGALAKGE